MPTVSQYDVETALGDRGSVVEDLVGAQVEHGIAVLGVRQCGDALADPDPWRGFCSAIERVCAMQVADRGFSAAFLTAFPEAIDFDRLRDRAEERFDEVVRRAKESGDLRADFDRADLALVLRANAGVTAGSPDAALAASRRLVAYLLQAFRAGGGTPLPPPAPLALRPG